jgi:hypothetical protein
MTTSRLRILLISVALTAACAPREGAGRTVTTAAVDSRNDDATPVASTAHFELRSRFDFNLYDRLRQWGVRDDRAGSSCIAALPVRDRDGWSRAVQAFGALRPGAVPPKLELRLAYELALPNDRSFDENLGPVPGWYRRALADGAPAYRRCWWSDDDRRNREWILTAAARLARTEDAIARHITQAHRVELPTERISVDVVPTIDFAGANTVVHPNHILIASAQPSNEGYGALEALFHEASHTMVGPRSEGSVAALRQAAQRQGVELPADLWHAVLFYTAGDATKKAVREAWGEPYLPYLYTSGLFVRAWPTWREPLERSWQPYLDGSSSLERAADELVVSVARKR